MNRWNLIQELFEETRALAPDARETILHARAGADTELVQHVQALVDAYAAPVDLFDQDASELIEALQREPAADELCGQTFGPYRIDEHLSSGGMGHVYRATRSSAGTERRVALKVLRPRLATTTFLERFRREREMLARLEHEHIVSFLDAGTLPDGRPFFVMQFVEGVSLTTWGQSVSLRARLVLFLDVLGAVQYAHQQLIVHRDLKPSNVLITGQGVPKVLDFGVAGALAAKSETGAAGAPLTPVYASPEQRRGEAPTAASDIFSLGLLLHELVTGELPRAEGEGTTKAIDGDLGAIVRKAVSIEPGRRYRSADLMADDLRRWLASEPVSARAGGWLYVSALFARRNRWPLLAAIAVLLAVVAGWIGSDLDRRRAEREASTGWGAHAQAKFVAQIFEDWIAEATTEDASLGTGAALYLETVLRDELGELPEAETLVRLTLARLYLENGNAERARIHADRAWELSQATRGVSEHERERARDLLSALDAPSD